MDSKDSDLQILKQYQGFLKTGMMVNQLPETKILAMQSTLSPKITPLEVFPFELARTFSFLGKRAEVFFQLYLKQSRRYREIAYSLQIIKDKTTLGEFDFICFDNDTDKVIHVELVNKIYLFDDGLHEDPDFCWIGPNRRDRFIDKVEKLKAKQFPLLYHPDAEATLNELDLDPWKIQQRLCFKAILFLPENGHIRFHKTNLNCISGYYYTLKEFLDKPWKDHKFYIPKKINWFVDETQHTHWHSYSKILMQLQHLLEQNQSPMLFRKDESENTFKCFVVWW
ncbi:hypothetical protein pgond44_06325 [Psychroflexus gondwanensis ACAM 44]|uniref:DUF1853 domain-containing protein n=1 Tax=Psychroflexus gondwanensis ACAM 44 TaxID=1189619 RepID=N1WR48_9FLAO|nr:DUF1853 family protein [Psychroflexus gondwanensis]EMY81445.1 hypothetical protein pgond44_06325 [Psychroflexus gondwanensis ACAM 44]